MLDVGCMAETSWINVGNLMHGLHVNNATYMSHGCDRDHATLQNVVKDSNSSNNELSKAYLGIRVQDIWVGWLKHTGSRKGNMQRHEVCWFRHKTKSSE